MSDYRIGTGKEQDTPGTSCYARKQGSIQRMMGIFQKDTEALLEGLPPAKLGTI